MTGAPSPAPPRPLDERHGCVPALGCSCALTATHAALSGRSINETQAAVRQ